MDTARLCQAFVVLVAFTHCCLAMSVKTERSAEDIEDTEEDRLREFPLGTIVAWTPILKPDMEPMSLPRGWLVCDGKSVIPEGPLQGLTVPDLNGEYGFLRGGPAEKALEREDDQLLNHTHIDNGHTHSDAGHTHRDHGHLHVDKGHTHTDAGHMHTDTGHSHVDSGHSHTDRGHSHSDRGHRHSDSGHNHNYDDKYVAWKRGSLCSGRYWGGGSRGRTTYTGRANIQTSHASITTSKAQITTNKANIGKSFAQISKGRAAILNGRAEIQPGQARISMSQAKIGVNKASVGGVDAEKSNAAGRVGSETRPKSVRVVWIMKVF